MQQHQKNRITTNSSNSRLWESQQVELYARIQALTIDQPGASFPFSERLAREHQWSLLYTQRVIEEYKKFLFLAIVADHPVTPSNAVDQAWHLHLTYTHSYWNDLCAQILSRPLHHHPTQGGQQQRELFWDCYSKTLNSYESFLGYCAPADIWPTPVTQFQQAGHFRQVNAQDYWIIPKPNFIPFQQVWFNILHRSWLQTIIIVLLTTGLVFVLDALYHPAIAACLDLINAVFNQSTVAQVSPPPNSYTPSTPEVKPTQGSRWMWWGIIAGSCLIFGFLCVLRDSRCPKCDRFWFMKTTTVLIRRSTELEEGAELVTSRCKCCNYTEEKYRTIPRKPNTSDSDVGCCCI